VCMSVCMHARAYVRDQIEVLESVWVYVLIASHMCLQHRGDETVHAHAKVGQQSDVEDDGTSQTTGCARIPVTHSIDGTTNHVHHAEDNRVEREEHACHQSEPIERVRGGVEKKSMGI
jgi:hypothetical protein